MNLRTYIKFFIKKRLNVKYYSLNDIVSEVYCSILSSRNLSSQLREYVERDEVPSNKKLSLLKAVIFRTRLKYINKENVHLTGERKGTPSNVKISCLPEFIKDDSYVEYFHSPELLVELQLKAQLKKVEEKTKLL